MLNKNNLKLLAVLYKIGEIFNEKCWCNTYCVEICGNAYKTNEDPMIKRQTRAFGIIYKAC